MTEGTSKETTPPTFLWWAFPSLLPLPLHGFLEVQVVVVIQAKVSQSQENGVVLGDGRVPLG